MTSPGNADALSFLEKHSVGVVATLSSDTTPRARTVYYASDDSFSVYFFTLSGTRKVEDIAKNAHAAFVVSDETTPQTIQIEGTLSNLSDTATITAVVQKLTTTFTERGVQFAPLTHLDPGKIVFYKLTPTWVRFGDFTNGFGADNVFTELPL